MSAKPPLFMLVKQPELYAVEHVGDLYDLRYQPAPGIAAALVGGYGVDAAMMDEMPDLRLIAIAGVGYDKTDVAYARVKGIAVTNTPDVLTNDVADLAIGLMVAVARRLPAQDLYVRQGRWEREGAPPLARRASGRRIGVLGLGRIGQAVAARARPFASEIGYFSRHPRPEAADYHYAASPRALAEWADVMIVTVSGGPGTLHLVDRAVIDALGAEGTLINVSRGSVVDEQAMVAALIDGRLGCAGLDVFAGEPRVPAALLDMPNVVLAPHQGSATRETRQAMSQLALDNLAAFFAGRSLLTPV